jgi:hypothetical protein
VNPQHDATPERKKYVEALAAYGVPQDMIASLVGIDPKTLRLHYRDQLDHGKWRANAKVAEGLFNQCVKPSTAPEDWKPNTTAQIFWLKCQAGWKETVDVNVPNGIDHRHTGAVAVATPEQIAAMSDDQLASLVRGAITGQHDSAPGLNGHGVNGHAGNGAGVHASEAGSSEGDPGSA